MDEDDCSPTVPTWAGMVVDRSCEMFEIAAVVVKEFLATHCQRCTTTVEFTCSESRDSDSGK